MGSSTERIYNNAQQRRTDDVMCSPIDRVANENRRANLIVVEGGQKSVSADRSQHGNYIMFDVVAWLVKWPLSWHPVTASFSATSWQAYNIVVGTKCQRSTDTADYVLPRKIVLQLDQRIFNYWFMQFIQCNGCNGLVVHNRLSPNSSHFCISLPFMKYSILLFYLLNFLAFEWASCLGLIPLRRGRRQVRGWSRTCRRPASSC